PKSDRAQPTEAVVISELVGETHGLELANGSGRQPVATGLLTREVLLLDDENVVARLGQPVGAGGAGRPSTHDQDVVGVFTHQNEVTAVRLARRSRRS